jgi:hypothetical protein
VQDFEFEVQRTKAHMTDTELNKITRRVLADGEHNLCDAGGGPPVALAWPPWPAVTALL